MTNHGNNHNNRALTPRPFAPGDAERLDDAISELEAREDAERGTSPIDPTAHARMSAFYQALRAEVNKTLARQRAERAERTATTEVRPSILAMLRDAVLARLGDLLAISPERAAFANRNYADLSDDELRRMLEHAERLHEARAKN